MKTLLALTATLGLTALAAWPLPPKKAPAKLAADPLTARLRATVQPLLNRYCIACHGKNKPQAQLDLTLYPDVGAVVADFPHWVLLKERLLDKTMPPTGLPQPTEKERDALVAFIDTVCAEEIRKNAGDPGPNPPRRLSNAELDNTIRDLTGQDLRPARTFPVDPANQEGFDNSAESLTISPALAKKYAQAAKEVADHLALTSTGFAFAPHPVVGETDRDKFCSLRIVDFYKRQPTDLADYFQAAWRYKHRAMLSTPDKSIEAVAAEKRVSPRYLRRIWELLTLPDQRVGPVATLQKRFAELPAPLAGDPDCAPLREWVVSLRRKVAFRWPNLRVPAEFSTGSQCNILWKDRQYASHRRTFDPNRLQIGGIPATRTIPARRNRPEQSVTDSIDPDLAVPEDEIERAPFLESFKKFADTFPDAFYIDQRGLMEGDGAAQYEPSGRLLTAGSHNAMGYFRDDAPLRELILDEKGNRELETLWRDFSSIASWRERMHLQFFFYERNEARTILTGRDPEFDFAKPEDKGNLSEERIQKFADLYLAKARRKGGEPETLKVFEEHFQLVSAGIRTAERDRLAAEPVHKKALLAFAQKAYRRPLTDAERAALLEFYTALRTKSGLSHEDALRDCVQQVLLSPHFLFHLSLSPSPEENGRSPLSDYALASRLSYFLWSSMPDGELLALAAQKKLQNPAVLAVQAQRMLKSPKARALALEFGGNWLDFRRFEEHNAVDRARFPNFDDALRQSMFEEPVRFMLDTFQKGGDVRDWLYGTHTFVNAPLAKHYGMTEIKPEGDGWVRVEDAPKYGRGGLLPMAVFLTKNASSLRTSPVRRGYWVVRKVLGEHIPPPPAVVPELPKDEHELGEKTLRQALESHRKSPACSGCHARFDSYGLVFEKFGPIGELREKDGGGKPVDSRAPFPGVGEREGVAGLQNYLKEKRERDFLQTFGRKLVSYGLGRTLLPSDEPLLDSLQKKLRESDYRFPAMVETIVASPQFRTKRREL